MKEIWDEIVRDPNERSVFIALSDPNWDFRTVEGLTKSTSLSQSEIEQIISKYYELIRESPVRDKKGRRLFTLKSKKVPTNKICSIIDGIVSIFSRKSITLNTD